MINGAHRVDRKAMALQAESSARAKAWRPSGHLQQTVTGTAAGEVGRALPSRGLECQAQRLGFHHESARETLKRDQMSLALWKGFTEAERRLEQSG